MGRCGGVSLSTHTQRGSTEKELDEPGRTKNKKRTRKERPVHFGRYPVYAVPLSGIQCWRYLLGGIESWRSSVGGIDSWRYILAVSIVGGIFFGGRSKNKVWRVFVGGNDFAVSGFSVFGGNTLAVGGITKP